MSTTSGPPRQAPHDFCQDILKSLPEQVLALILGGSKSSGGLGRRQQCVLGDILAACRVDKLLEDVAQLRVEARFGKQRATELAALNSCGGSSLGTLLLLTDAQPKEGLTEHPVNVVAQQTRRHAELARNPDVECHGSRRFRRRPG